MDKWTRNIIFITGGLGIIWYLTKDADMAPAPPSDPEDVSIADMTVPQHIHKLDPIDIELDVYSPVAGEFVIERASRIHLNIIGEVYFEEGIFGPFTVNVQKGWNKVLLKNCYDFYVSGDTIVNAQATLELKVVYTLNGYSGEQVLVRNTTYSG